MDNTNDEYDEENENENRDGGHVVSRRQALKAFLRTLGTLIYWEGRDADKLKKAKRKYTFPKH